MQTLHCDQINSKILRRTLAYLLVFRLGGKLLTNKSGEFETVDYQVSGNLRLIHTHAHTHEYYSLKLFTNQPNDAICKHLLQQPVHALTMRLL
jgi:hypothetical protein